MQVDRKVIGKFIDATVQDQAEAARLLLEHPGLRQATWFGEKESVLAFLVVEGFVEGVRFCLENGFPVDPDVDGFGTTPLIEACKLGHAEIAVLLLAHGAKPDQRSEVDDNPLFWCVRNGNAELLDTLLKYGANPNYVTDLGETIFDGWPNNPDRQASLATVLEKHGVVRNNR